MPLYRPSELRMLLDTLGTRAKKCFSQNFLIDGNIIRKIITAADVKADDVIVEIGPGPGALTEALVSTRCTVVAIEKDRVFADRIATMAGVDVFCDDILSFPLEETLLRFLPKGKKAKVVANIPYSLTSPLLTMLTPMHGLFSSLTLMVQQEVAKRCTAEPGSKDYSSLTIFLRYYSRPSYKFLVKRGSFYPAPNVDSAVISLELKTPDYGIDNPEQFFTMVRTAFQQRRKMLSSSLRPLFSPEKIRTALTSMNKRPDARPQDLSLEDFIVLYQDLY